MAQNLIRARKGSPVNLSAAQVNAATAWQPLFLAIDGSADGTLVANDLSVTVEFAADSGCQTADYQVPAGATKFTPIPGAIFYRIQNANRPRGLKAQQVSL